MRGLPVPDPQRLVAVDAAPGFYASGSFEGRNRLFTWAQVEELGRQQQAFSGLLALGTTRFDLSRGGEARYAHGLYVTRNFLEVLGVAPALGHWSSTPSDARDYSGAGVLLNHAFWTREYGGDPAVIGRSLSVEGQPFPILAVTPPSFAGVEPDRRFDVAVPLCADAAISQPVRGGCSRPIRGGSPGSDG